MRTASPIVLACAAACAACAARRPSGAPAPAASTAIPVPIRAAAPRASPSGRRADADFDQIGVGRALSSESPDAAVARAREDALSKAMLGASDVFYGFSDYSSQDGRSRRESAAKFIFTSNQGVLTELSSGSPECEVEDGVTTCRLRVRGAISFRGAVDPSYQILDQESGKLLGLDRRQYYDGEPVRLSFAATKDSYLYIFSWDEEDKLLPVFPSRFAKDNRVKAGEPLVLPVEGSGVSYRAALPAGKTSSSEKLLVVAALREIAAPEAGEGTLLDLTRRLAALERREWTLQVVPYEILARSAKE